MYAQQSNLFGTPSRQEQRAPCEPVRPPEANSGKSVGEPQASEFDWRVGPEGVVIVKYLGRAANVKVPETMGGKIVRTIAGKAFANRRDVKSVELPNTITRIDGYAFDECLMGPTFAIPPSVNVIGFNAFQHCDRLVSVTVPADVTSIGAVCFNQCLNLKRIDVDPKNRAYSSIDGVLYDKDQQTLITIPAGRQGMVKLPRTVRIVPNWSVQDCRNLQKLCCPARPRYAPARFREHQLKLSAIEGVRPLVG